MRTVKENVASVRKRLEGGKERIDISVSVKTKGEELEMRKRASLRSSTSQSQNQHHRRNQRKLTRLKMREPSSPLSQLPVVLRTSPRGNETSKQVKRERRLLPALQTTAIERIHINNLPRWKTRDPLRLKLTTNESLVMMRGKSVLRWQREKETRRTRRCKRCSIRRCWNT